MSNDSRLVGAFSFALLLLLAACGSGHELSCFPNTMRCGGPQGNLLQRCVSASNLWETLTDCQSVGQVCQNGACVLPGDGDGESDTDGESACLSDAQCPADAICTDGTCTATADLRADLVAQSTRLIFRRDLGRVSLYDTQGKTSLYLATAAAELMDPQGKSKTLSFAGLPAERLRFERRDQADAMGQAQRLWITRVGQNGEPTLIWQLAAYTEEGFFTFAVKLIEESGAEGWKISKLIPLTAGGDGKSGLFLASAPPRQRILENGCFSIFDHYVRLLPGDAPYEFITTLLPGGYQGHSVSNWNHAVIDLAGGSPYIAGALTFGATLPTFNLAYDPQKALTLPDGRVGYSLASAETAYLPLPKPLGAGAVFLGELIYVHPGETSVFVGLERYARMIKANLGITLWNEKDAANRVPNGWNSWSGGGGSGGYGTDINESIILANLDVAAEDFKEFGMEWFQIDAGWAKGDGDWQWDPTRFPHGGKWMAERIKEKGFKAGLWMSALNANPDSQLVKDHPSWVAPKVEFAAKVGVAKGYALLDLANPEVQGFIKDTATTVRKDWGFDWLKVDFAYWDLLAQGVYDPTLTREEAYKKGMGILREALGSDAFLLVVAIMGLNYGVADANRLTIDNMPVWDHDPHMAATESLVQPWQGLKPVMRAVARRYYLHNRVWLNHPDLIFFRSNPNDTSWPRLTLDESTAFSSFVGLSGGIVKLGDKLVDLTPEEVNVVRKLLPAYPESARPLDLFEHEYPERWHLPIRYGQDGYNEAYELVGLFNWGANTDLSVNPYVAIPDSTEAKTFSVKLSDLGLNSGLGKSYLAFEFWTQKFLGRVSDTLSLDVPAHSARVVALRNEQSVPQFLGTNRQLTMGGTLFGKPVWNDETKVLEVPVKVAKPGSYVPFVTTVSLHVPAGYTFKELTSEGVYLSMKETKQDGEILTLSLVPAATGNLSLKVAFKGPGAK